MKNLIHFLLLFFVFVTSTNAFANFSCFNFVPPKDKPTIPDLPITFKTLIEIVNDTDLSKTVAFDIWETYDGIKKLSVLRQEVEDPRDIPIQWIFNQSAKDYIKVERNYTCEAAELSKLAVSPLYFPLSVSEKPFKSLVEIWDYIKKQNISAVPSTGANDTDAHDHGIPVENYLVCSKSKDGSMFIEFNICLTEKNFTVADSDMKQQVPTRIELKVYKGSSVTNVTQIDNIIYEMSAYRKNVDTKLDYESYLPPVGVFCEGVEPTKAFPDLPKKLSVHIEYTDFVTSDVDANALIVDDDRHMVGFKYTTNHTDEPVAVKANLTKHNVRIIHDFTSGLQYIVDTQSDACVSVSSISPSSGDVDDSAKGLGIKNVLNILLTPENVKFVYVGVRYASDVPYDVFVARANDTLKANEFKVYEAWVLHSNWSLDNGFGGSIKNLPVYFKVYHGENQNRTISMQHFHDYKIYDKMPVPWVDVDVFPCLSFVQNLSYLVVQMEGSEEQMKKVGLETMKNNLREKLADAAGVSALRITEFYFQPVGLNNIYVFFLLANRSDVEGAKTQWSKEEIDVEKAHEKLNLTLAANDLVIEIDKEKFTVMKNTLNLVPPYFHPSNATAPTPSSKTINIGYSSGSMAGLGICMILIGGIVGFGLAFFLWKRNRGIAYQIYE